MGAKFNPHVSTGNAPTEYLTKWWPNRSLLSHSRLRRASFPAQILRHGGEETKEMGFEALSRS